MNLCMNISKKRMPTLNRTIKVPTTSLYGLITSGLIVQGYYMKKNYLSHPKKVIYLIYISGLLCKQTARLSLSDLYLTSILLISRA